MKKYLFAFGLVAATLCASAYAAPLGSPSAAGIDSGSAVQQVAHCRHWSGGWHCGYPRPRRWHCTRWSRMCWRWPS